MGLAELWYLAQGPIFGARSGRSTRSAPSSPPAGPGCSAWPAGPGAAAGADAARRRRRPGAVVFPAARQNGGRPAHSPDLQICATDVDALRRGDYTVVLGELHAAWASFDCAVFTPAAPDVSGCVRRSRRTSAAADPAALPGRLAPPHQL